MSDTFAPSLVQFSKYLDDKCRYLSTVNKRKYSNTEIDASSAETVAEIKIQFEKLLAIILCDTQFVSTDPYINRLMKRETSRREFHLCEGTPTNVIQMSLF